MPKKASKQKKPRLVIILLLLLSIPVTVFAVKMSSDIRSRASLSDDQELSVRVSLLDQREGFAKSSDVTGGANGSICRVTNLSDTGTGSLRYCAGLGNRWIVFGVNGTINLSSRVSIASNTTIDGRGADITITGKGLYFNDGKENLIIENLKIKNIGTTNEDAINIDKDVTRFWLDHLTIQDAYDGYIDIAASYSRGMKGTVSWNLLLPGKSYYWDLVHVVGDNRPCCAQYNKNIMVTFHHNYFNGTRQRNPSASGAKVHSYNNYIKWRLYGMSVKSPDAYPNDHGQIYSENDIWDRAVADSKNQGDINNNGGKGYARVISPLKLNGADPRESNPSGVFNPSNYYSYTAETANSTLKTKLETMTGWRPASEFNFSGGTASPTPTIPPVIYPTGVATPTSSNVPQASESDVTAPNISITQPSDGSVVSAKSELVISAVASDDVSINKVEFYANNSLVCTNITAPYSCVWSLPGAPNKTYNIKAVATDTSGNTASSTVNISSSK